MADATGKQYPVGLRYGSVFQLDSEGFPQAPTTTYYEGRQFKGSRAWELTLPPPRTIVHPGDDRVQAVDYLPTLEAATGILRVSRYDIGLNALLTNVASYYVGEAVAMSWQTDQQGEEIDAGLFLYQQSLEGDTKVRNWRSFIIPSCRIIPTPGGMTDSQQDTVYNIAINPITRQLWGTALAMNVEGALEHGVVELHSERQPWLVWFRGNGAATTFAFNTNKLAYNTAKMEVWNDGVNVDAPTVTKSTTNVVFGSPPANGNIVGVWYELAG